MVREGLKRNVISPQLRHPAAGMCTLRRGGKFALTLSAQGRPVQSPTIAAAVLATALAVAGGALAQSLPGPLRGFQPAPATADLDVVLPPGTLPLARLGAPVLADPLPPRQSTPFAPRLGGFGERPSPAEAGRARLGCATTYYSCLAGEAPDACGEQFARCTATASNPQPSTTPLTGRL